MQLTRQPAVGIGKGLKLPVMPQKCRIYFFADDLLLLGKASIKHAKVMRNILEKFCGLTSQKVNLAKLKVWYSSNVSQTLIQTITQQFGVPSTPNLRMYLGVPIQHGRVTSKNFQYLKEKVRKKLEVWKSKLLSIFTRLLLIQFVCSMIRTYAMNTRKLLGKTMMALERMNRNFFWDDTKDYKSTHIVS